MSICESRVGDLTAANLGRRIRIPNLHQPGTAFDAPKVSVEGTLIAIRKPGRTTWWPTYIRLELRPKSAALNTPLPLDHIVELL